MSLKEPSGQPLIPGLYARVNREQIAVVRQALPVEAVAAVAKLVTSEDPDFWMSARWQQLLQIGEIPMRSYHRAAKVGHGALGAFVDTYQSVRQTLIHGAEHDPATVIDPVGLRVPRRLTPMVNLYGFEGGMAEHTDKNPRHFGAVVVFALTEGHQFHATRKDGEVVSVTMNPGDIVVSPTTDLFTAQSRVYPEGSPNAWYMPPHGVPANRTGMDDYSLVLTAGERTPIETMPPMGELL